MTRTSTRRSWQRAAVLAAIAAHRGVRTALLLPSTPREQRAVLLADAVTDAAERCGPAFVKLGQLASTRADLVPPVLATALSRLQDRVAPLDVGTARQLTATRLPGRQLGTVGPALAGGSVASVHPAGRDQLLAVKLLRPDAVATMTGDVALVLGALRFVARWGRSDLAAVGLTVVGQVGNSLLAQLDLVSEADRTRAALDLLPPEVRVPEVVAAADGVLVTRLLPDLVHGTAEVVSPAARHRAAVTICRTVFAMIFDHGQVHCDLHGGNLFVAPDGTVTVLDFGFVHALSAEHRAGFAGFFDGLVRGDAAHCAEAVLAHAVLLRAADVVAFRGGLTDLVARSSGRGSAEFRLGEFCRDLMLLQHRHGVFAAPEFAFPLLCLATAESTVTALDPGLDFQLEAAPWIMTALVAASCTPSGGHP